MSRPIGRHGDRDGFRGDMASRIMRILRGSVPPLLVLFLVLIGMILKVPPATTGSIPCDCETCHSDFHGANWAGCSGCHPSPPQDGTHLVHYNSPPQNSLRYGDTTVKSTTEAYMFGCGNCHPLDKAKHNKGTVDVELYDPLAPPGSLKAKNPSTAAYDPATKTCRDVYCHSGSTITSGPVGAPLTSPPNEVPPGYTLDGQYILDPTGNLTYAPYTVTYARDYKTTPAWGTTGTFTTCKECHAFPLTTWDPAVYAGVGDSHAWVDEYGYQNLHAWNMGFGGVPCATCHFGSVDHRDGNPALPASDYVTSPVDGYIFINGFIYYPVPVKDRSLHVNGTPDIAFDLSGYLYDTYREPTRHDLASATYDAQTKTCSNVSCHHIQTTVKWGSPYRWYDSAECNICHSY